MNKPSGRFLHLDVEDELHRLDRRVDGADLDPLVVGLLVGEQLAGVWGLEHGRVVVLLEHDERTTDGHLCDGDINIRQEPSRR